MNRFNPTEICLKDFKVPLFSLSILFLMSLGYGVFYNGWWKFVPSTIFLISATSLFFPANWQKYLGLVGSFKAIWIGLLLCLAFAALSHFVIRYSLPDRYQIVLGHYLDYLMPPFQTLNEEMVFRGLLLTGLVKLGLGEWKIILLPALVFSAFHWIFYYFNMKPDNQGIVDYSALATLLLFGITTNILFLATRSIILPWALHCGWNINRFGNHIIAANEPEKRISEYLSFNLLEGSTSVLVLSIVIAGIAIAWAQSRNFNRNQVI